MAHGAGEAGCVTVAVAAGSASRRCTVHPSRKGEASHDVEMEGRERSIQERRWLLAEWVAPGAGLFGGHQEAQR